MYNRILPLLFFGLHSFAYEYPKIIDGYFSQRGQDKYLNEQVFNGKKNGVFVEVGAHDGISFSNTYFFEKYLNWQGVCVEPNSEIFSKLIKNRQCACEQIVIAEQSDKMLFLKCTGYMLEMYSGLLSSMDPRHMDRIFKEMIEYGGSAEIIVVTCATLNNLFQRHNLTYIDLLSIDIEGGEEKVVKSIDFDAVEIDVILVENNFNEDKVYNYLLTKGYERIQRLGKDDIYKLMRG